MKYFLILIFVFLAVLGFFWQGIFLPLDSQKEKNFLVKKGDSLGQIAENLEKEGFIKKDYFFRIYAMASKKSSLARAGEYELSSAMNVPEILAKLTSGDRIKRQITLIEGWNVGQVKNYLQTQGMENLDILDGLEGYLFPDTYEIFPEDGLEGLLDKINLNFESKLTLKMSQDMEMEGRNLTQIITMASLIEKEVKTLEDKKIVSGILWKRIKAGMPLQVDAAIVYITGKNSTAITKEELQIDSPFNTYKYKGLPPSPICSPGLDSILAAIYPEDSDYWFYLSTPAGETIFSRNYEEHRSAIENYLK